MEQTTEGLADHAQDMALHHPLDRQPWDGITEQDDTVWFDIACWGRIGSRCLREAVKGSGTTARKLSSLEPVGP